MNPDWKILVTEKGFIRDVVSFTQQVNDLMNELQQSKQISLLRSDGQLFGEIPPVGRNDNSPKK